MNARAENNAVAAKLSGWAKLRPAWRNGMVSFATMKRGAYHEFSHSGCIVFGDQISCCRRSPFLGRQRRFCSITRTSEELSIVCSSSDVPDHVRNDIESDWKCMKVAGLLDFQLTGVLSSLDSDQKKKTATVPDILSFLLLPASGGYFLKTTAPSNGTTIPLLGALFTFPVVVFRLG